MKHEPVRWWLSGLLIAIILAVLPMPAWFVDRLYSRNIYRWIQGAATGLSNLAPFAVLDLLIIAAFALVIWRAVRLIGVARRSGVLAALWEGARRLVRAAALLTIVFVVMWGFNYRRLPLEATVAGAAVHQPSVDELMNAVADANSLAARLRAPSAVDPSLDFRAVSRMLAEPFGTALVSLGQAPITVPGRPKYSLVLTPFFTWAGVNGMVDPLALESIVHPDLLPFERPFVLAHEWAHLAGRADEAEASAIAWLACMRGGSELAYSASLYLIAEAGSALPPAKWRDASKRLDADVRADLAAIAQRAARERPVVRRTAFRVYDQYLRANRVDDGVASYSRALSLILSSPIHDALGAYQAPRDRAPR